MSAPTTKQVAFAATLSRETGIEVPAAALADRRAMSTFISAALLAKRAAPAAAAAPAPEANTPAPGYYALDYQGVLRFYAVREGKGKWAGRTFLNRYRSDYQDRVGAAERTAAYAVIAADPQAARMRFATETTHCYACGRRLTDATSRELGIGPDCRAR